MSDKLKGVWAVTFSFYTPGICGGRTVANVLADGGLQAIEVARKNREKHHNTRFEKFDVEKVEQICQVEWGYGRGSD